MWYHKDTAVNTFFEEIAADIALEKDLKYMACGFYQFTLANPLVPKRVMSLQGKKVSYWPLSY